MGREMPRNVRADDRQPRTKLCKRLKVLYDALGRQWFFEFAEEIYGGQEMSRTGRRKTARNLLLGGGLMLLVVACAGGRADPYEKVGDNVYVPESRVEQATGGRITGDGIVLFGSKALDDDRGGGGGIGVNSFLWRASLDTISFMPLSSADPFGGVIITEWYTPPESPDERFKLTVYILDTRLRADGVRVALFRQEREQGEWEDSEASPVARTELEDAILTRARQLRISSTVR